MIRNYLTTAFRIMLRQRVYSAINIFGLTLGIASCLVLVLYIGDELSYDQFHHDADRLYRVDFHARLNGQDIHSARTGVPMAEGLMNEVPQVESVVRVNKWNTIPVRYEEKIFTEKRFLLADSNFFEFFNFKLIAGNPKEALKGPHKVVISTTAARKYFGYKGPGDMSPIGKVFAFGSMGETTAEVTGIAEDGPSNSHLHFDFVLSLQTWDDLWKQTVWLNNSLITYFKIKPNADIKDVDAKYSYFIEKYCVQELERFLQMNWKQFKEHDNDLYFTSTPVMSIHLHSQISEELEANGNIQYLYLFGAIALFIIVLACINFMNLSTARSSNRAKEVGVRKSIGALRSRLVGQFLMESYLYAIISVILAMVLISLSLNFFNQIASKEIQFTQLIQPQFIGGLLLFILIIGLLAGSYPAFYLTSFRPVEVLKGKVRAGMKSSGIRNGLVVFQFVISIGLIISTLMVYRQLNYVQSKNLGFDKENVMNLLHTLNLGKNAVPFKNELMQHPEVVAASYANRLPPSIDWNSVIKTADTKQEHYVSFYLMDYDHLKALGYTMASGRFFSRDFPTDSSAILINETAARQMGLENFEGKSLLASVNSPSERSYHIIGILKDFNFESLKTNIRPMAVMLGTEPNYEMAIRLTSGNTAAKVKLVERIWKKYAPQAPFEFSFLDQNFDAQFRAEQRMGEVFIFFTGLAIVIACLGLLGLATFAAEQRAKEISIRKIMGSSISGIVFLLTKDFARLILIAFVLALPITWYALEKWWLEGFAYRVGFDVTVMAVAGVVAVVVGLLTIGYQSVKAAMGNPVDSLKNE
ncbi:MAG: ABC transporter permease [Bacteroidetes bacterium]|nr:ABC transporter permease [Bacteroidota bacterium]